MVLSTNIGADNDIFLLYCKIANFILIIYLTDWTDGIEDTMDISCTEGNKRPCSPLICFSWFSYGVFFKLM